MSIHARKCPDLAGFRATLESAGYSPRWPDQLAAMPRHCLEAPVEAVLWVHEEAEPLWDPTADWTMDCQFSTDFMFGRNVTTIERSAIAQPEFSGE